MCVRQVLRLSSGYTYPICPACKITLEREYQCYCDRCGQCLNWNRYDKAVIIQWTKGYKNSPVLDAPENNGDKDVWHRICNRISLIKENTLLM